MKRFAVVTVYHSANDETLLSTMESKEDAEVHLNTLAKGAAELGYDVSSFGVGERPYEPYYLGELCVLAWLPETPEDHEQDMSIMMCMVH